MRRTALLWGLLLAVAPAMSCKHAKTTSPDGGLDDGGGQVAAASCLDQPTQLAQPPGTSLPCELLPPGFHR